MKRRGFLGSIAKGAGAIAALFALPGCDSAGLESAAVSTSSGGCGGEDLAMHGPVKPATEALQLPVADSALDLFAPYTDGRVFQRGWAIAHVGRGYDDQIVIVLVDLETGGHAELELWRIHPVYAPVAETWHYGVYINNAGNGDMHTPRHLERLAQALADVVETNEVDVALSWELPHLGTRGRGPSGEERNSLGG